MANGIAGVPATFEEFLTSAGSVQVDLQSLVIALLLATLLSFLLARLYVKYGTSLSNRKRFADNFVLITVATTLVITIVKSSLALSLGLVGALSIVRFRAAIKEPEELTFLFLTIAMGLGLGANQFSITIVSFLIMSVIIWGRHFYHKKDENQNLYLSVVGQASSHVTLDNIKKILEKHCTAVQLRRFDHTADDGIDATFLIDVSAYASLERALNDLKKLSKNLTITYMDKIGVH
ncbi:DUF4956 domain-containing protein [Candidatus Pacearchaeota archaeon]|nr:DUF4956 domain-containing protein [Candidatus Pacearchaeota archaeon]